MTQTFLPVQRKGSEWMLWLLLLFVSAILIFVLFMLGGDLAGMRTMQYEVTGQDLVIHYGWKSQQVPLDEIVKSWRLERSTEARRLMGTSMPGLKQGRWRLNETGQIILYATQLQPLVVVETADRRFGFSPADPDGFMQALTDRRPSSFKPIRQTDGSGLWAAVPVLLGFLVIGAALLTFWHVTRFRRRLRYELGPDGLTIHTGWRPAQIPYREIRTAQIASPKGVPLRMMGTAVGGLLWGAFAWRAAGPKLRLYSTRIKPLVLIHLAERTVGITPAEEEQFLKALQARLR